VAYKEVNFKSKLIEWTQKNRVNMEFRMLKQTQDEKGSPVFGFLAVIEGVEGCSAQGYSKKEAQQLCSKETLQRLRREPQFIDAIFQAKSERTKMEEMPTMAAPNLEQDNTSFIIEQERERVDEKVTDDVKIDSRKEQKSKKTQDSKASQNDDFDLSDITHLKNKAEQSREEIIAMAEAAAFSQH
jgi:ribonuclease-3